MKKIIFMVAAVAFLGTYSATAQEVAANAKTEIKKEKKEQQLFAKKCPRKKWYPK